jgi:ATP-binding cassette subfamily F protein uup
VGEYAGGYADWVRQRPVPAGAIERPVAKAAAPVTVAAPTGKKRRLSFKESKELEALPQHIDALEQERERLYASLADPAFLRDGAAVVEAKARLAAVLAEIGALTERWEALETLASEAG